MCVCGVTDPWIVLTYVVFKGSIKSDVQFTYTDWDEREELVFHSYKLLY